MNNAEIIANKDKLDSLFLKIGALSGDLELQSHWAKYLCVLTSGFLEKSISSIFKEYSRQRSAPPIFNFIEKRTSRFQNVNTEKILQLLESFNPDWADKLKRELEDEVKDSVDSIVANKNSIAHGISVGITYVRIKKYYENSMILIEKVEEVCS